jgi:two-component system sensor histidine kinase KdpD
MYRIATQFVSWCRGARLNPDRLEPAAARHTLLLHMLDRFAPALASAAHIDHVVAISDRFIRQVFGIHTLLLVPSAAGRLALQSARNAGIDLDLAQWSFDNSRAAGFGTDFSPGSDFLYVPLRAAPPSEGVIALDPRQCPWSATSEGRQALDTFGALIAIALERNRYADISQKALTRVEAERLRNSLLAAMSHDLRTPLTIMSGLAESLCLSPTALSPAQMESATAIYTEAKRMSSLVDNLLQMIGIEGAVELDLQWQSLEEVIGSALKGARRMLQGRPVRVEIAPEMPLLRFDAILIERVLINLFENIGKYTPAGSDVTISAQVCSDRTVVSVMDEGPGFPPGSEDTMFERFIRGARDSSRPGVGLGLAICRSIINAQNGEIKASNRSNGGARVTFSLPRNAAPDAPDGARSAGRIRQTRLRSALRRPNASGIEVNTVSANACTK